MQNAVKTSGNAMSVTSWILLAGTVVTGVLAGVGYPVQHAATWKTLFAFFYLMSLLAFLTEYTMKEDGQPGAGPWMAH